MAVIKLTRSKKAVQFIDDNGVVFQTSAAFVRKLLGGYAKSDFILLSRLPLKVAEGRFKKSPLYDPEGIAERMGDGSPSGTHDDSLSEKSRADIEKSRAYCKDKKVW